MTLFIEALAVDKATGFNGILKLKNCFSLALVTHWELYVVPVLESPGGLGINDNVSLWLGVPSLNNYWTLKSEKVRKKWNYTYELLDIDQYNMQL